MKIVDVVVTRLLHTQREQIATLKALGYRNAEVGWLYARLVGVITLNDVMSTVMGDLVPRSDDEEQQIVRRDENSWLIDGVTPIQDVRRELDIDSLPHAEEYETLAGFLMIMLRRVPKRTDSVTMAGYKFEVMDVDNHRIDQVMVTRASATHAAA